MILNVMNVIKKRVFHWLLLDFRYQNVLLTFTNKTISSFFNREIRLPTSRVENRVNYRKAKFTLQELHLFKKKDKKFLFKHVTYMSYETRNTSLINISFDFFPRTTPLE